MEVVLAPTGPYRVAEKYKEASVAVDGWGDGERLR